MSRIQVDNIYNKEGTGAPTFPVGVNVTGIITATSFDGIGNVVAGGDSGLMTGADKTKLDGLAPPLSDTVQSTSTTTNSPTTTTVTSGVGDVTLSYTLTLNGSTPEGTVTFSQGGNADDATLENFMQNVLGNAVTGESFTINYLDSSAQNRSSSFTINTVTITNANTMSGVEFTYSGGSIEQTPGNYDNIHTFNFQHTSLASYTVSITGSNNPIFDSTQQVTIDNVVYNANTWSVSGTTATQTLSSNPNITQGDSITQAHHGFITLAEKQQLDALDGVESWSQLDTWLYSP